MNILIPLIVAVIGIAAFSPFQLSKGIFGNHLINSDDPSAVGRFFFNAKSKPTNTRAVTTTVTTGTYSTCYCSVTTVTPCPTNRKKRQMPWIVAEPGFVQPLSFQIAGSQPYLAEDFNPKPWIPFYNVTNKRTAIGILTQNPVVKPAVFIGYERVQGVPVEYRFQANANLNSKAFLQKKQSDDSYFLSDGVLYSEPNVESSLSREAADSEGRFFFSNNAVVVSTITVTSFVATLAGIQQLAVACLPAGRSFPTPTCTNTCPILVPDLCQGLGNAFCSSGGTGVCDSRTGQCTCNSPFTRGSNGKCIACTSNDQCAAVPPAAGTCSSGTCTCTAGKIDANTGRCVVCTLAADCQGAAPAAGTCSTGSCTCTGMFVKVTATGKCVVCLTNNDCTGTGDGASGICDTVTGTCRCPTGTTLSATSGRCNLP